MKLPLNGTWQLRPVVEFQKEYPEDGWLSMEVPGHWQEHPKLEFYSGKMVYRKNFPFQVRQGRRYRLRLNGIFYWSKVHLNGTYLGENEGYFFPQEYEITDMLAKENTLLVEVDCPEEMNKVGKRMITGVFSHWDCLDPKTVPGGIWLPVEIVDSGPVYIQGICLETMSISATRAEVGCHILLDSSQPTPVRLRITFEPHNFTGKSQVFQKEVGPAQWKCEFDTTLEIKDPQLWWSHDLGEPNLYRVTVDAQVGKTTPSDSAGFNFGLRTFQMRDWISHLNGVRFLAKGNNYPPGDTRIARMTCQAYKRDLELAKAAHMNMLRVHAHVEHPAFYEAADEAGMLIWQDFPLQWSYSKKVLPEAQRQVEKMIHLLFNHPSIVVWCMHNEPLHIPQTTQVLASRRAFLNRSFLRMIFSVFVYSWNREGMDTKLKRLAQRLDTSRFVVRSSGEWALGFWREGTDSHPYYGWYPAAGQLREFEKFCRNKKDIRFVTEFGAQSFPNHESSIKFMEAELDRIDWGHLEERHHLQKAIMERWIDFQTVRNLRDLIEASQAYQVEVNRFYIDRLRYHKYSPTGGILPFLLLDSNPAIQWSLIDYWRVPKASYYAVQRAFNPEYIFTLLDKDSYKVGEEIAVPIYIVNDSRRDYPTVEVNAEVFNSGERTTYAAFNSSLEADSLAKLAKRLILRFESPGSRRLVLTLRYGESTLQNEYVLLIKGAKA